MRVSENEDVFSKMPLQARILNIRGSPELELNPQTKHPKPQSYTTPELTALDLSPQP